jgi:hypothetical protein
MVLISTAAAVSLAVAVPLLCQRWRRTWLIICRAQGERGHLFTLSDVFVVCKSNVGYL